MNDELKIKNNELGGKMKYRYRTDEEMKDSGVEWIGKIPHNWMKSKIKYTSNDEYKSFTDGDWIESPYITESGVRLIQTGNIGIGVYKEQGYRYISEKTFENLNCTEIKPNDVLICRLASPVGRACLAPSLKEKMVTSVDVCILKTNKFIDNRYIVYYLSCNGHIETAEMIARGGTRQRISRTQLGDMRFILPTLEEQEKIAKFLDKKTAQFDSIISKKEALIEKLEEAKKSLISEVVTGKVRVVKTDDGYELVERKKEEMKDSGVEWLGDIPKEWIRKKLKYNCYIKGRIGWQGLKQSEFIDEGPYLITGMNFKNGVINWSEVYHISEERYQEAPEIHLKLGDVLITKDGTIGKLLFIDYLPGKASLNSHLLVMRPLNNDFLPKFLYYSLDASYFKEYVEQVKTGTTFFGITQESISNFNLLIPSLDEQKIVIEYLDERLKILNEIIYKVKYEITKIKEAKKSLISEAVTGKIEILD